MVVIVAGVLAAVVVADPRPAGPTSSVGEALHVAGAAGRLNAIDFHFDWRQTYTFWSGLLGGLFLMLSYFGCDQSQVQRYLTAKSVDEGAHSLLMSAFGKIPLQALVLLTGVLVFVFYLFNQPPMLFNPVHGEKMQKSARGGGAAGARRRVHAGLRGAARGRRRARRSADAASDGPAQAAFQAADERGQRGPRAGGARWRASVGESGYKDSPATRRRRTSTTSSRRSSRRRLPIGLVGLIIAAIFAAAMSSIAAELNSLATATRDRHLPAPDPAGGERRALPARVVDCDRLLGRRSPASSRRSPPASARSSRSSTASGRSSTARCSASSCWRWRSGARTATARSSACSPASPVVAAVRVSPGDQRHLVPLAQPHRRHRRGGRRPASVSADGGQPGSHGPERAAGWYRLPRSPRASSRRHCWSSRLCRRAGGAGRRPRLRPRSSPAARSSTAPAHRRGVPTSRSRTAASPRSAAVRPRDGARGRSTPPGLVVAPGFIDVHTHADDLADHPRAENFVRMGVTSIVAGNCGSSALDVGEALAADPPDRRRDQLRDARSATTRCARR